MSKFKNSIQLIISPNKPNHNERICGQLDINLFFYIKNFLLSSGKSVNKNEEFKRVLYRQTSDLKRCPDKNAKISIGLSIYKKIDQKVDISRKDFIVFDMYRSICAKYTNLIYRLLIINMRDSLRSIVI